MFQYDAKETGVMTPPQILKLLRGIGFDTTPVEATRVFNLFPHKEKKGWKTKVTESARYSRYRKHISAVHVLAVNGAIPSGYSVKKCTLYMVSKNVLYSLSVLL